MGGFEGGDESGYWDVDSLPTPIYGKKKKSSHNKTTYIQTDDSIYTIKAHAKIDIFLKITGCENERFTRHSRCVRLEDVYDTISFVPSECESFTVEGCDTIPLESNSIYKAYKLLSDSPAGLDIVDFFCEHKVVVNKGIASSSGLGKSASNAAAFIRLAKEVCNLVLSTEELVRITSSISADIAFFIYNYPSANISGFGEVIEPFEEEGLFFELYSLNKKYDKDAVASILKEQLLINNTPSLFSDWNELDSKSILELELDPTRLNDFYWASLHIYPELKKEHVQGSFFSGNSFFNLINKDI